MKVPPSQYRTDPNGHQAASGTAETAEAEIPNDVDSDGVSFHGDEERSEGNLGDEEDLDHNMVSRGLHRNSFDLVSPAVETQAPVFPAVRKRRRSNTKNSPRPKG